MRKASTICGLLAGLAMISACNDKPTVEKRSICGESTKLEEVAKEETKYSLNVGEHFSPSYNMNGFIYGGTPNPNVNYSIVVIDGSGESAFAYNLYFSNSQKQISLGDAKITILEINSDKITFTYRK